MLKRRILPKVLNKFIHLILLYLLIFRILINCQPPKLKVHYLGHSAFVLEFDNGIRVVTDYGYENAWAEWGWDDPIASLNDLVPDVMTFSHTHHEDHYDPNNNDLLDQGAFFSSFPLLRGCF